MCELNYAWIFSEVWLGASKTCRENSRILAKNTYDGKVNTNTHIVGYEIRLG